MIIRRISAFVMPLVICNSIFAEDSSADISKLSQNPIANAISIPLQYNGYFGYENNDKLNSTVNFQPVYPVSLSDDFNLILRAIVPISHVPDGNFKDDKDSFGFGDTTISTFFTPVTESKFTWGIGPAFYLPTATGDALGTKHIGLGVSAVGLYSNGPWLGGGLLSHIESVGKLSDSNVEDLSITTIQPFVNYNLADGWYLFSSPIFVANWTAEEDDDIWKAPVGGGAGRTFEFNGVAMAVSAGGYYNAIRPDGSNEWEFTSTFKIILPK